MRDESERKWRENQDTITKMLKKIDAVDNKRIASIGAIGTRWSGEYEVEFCNILRGILGEVANAHVIHYEKHDDKCEVFEQPSQIELDIVIRNGVLMLCEIKFSVSRSDMNTFQRKVEFYERQEQRQATHKVIISPMIEPGAMDALTYHGIIVYSDSQNVVV